MSDQILNQILEELQSLKAGQFELQQLTRAIRDRQEESDAKLEALSMDVNKIHGNTVRIEQKLDDNINDVRGDIRYLSHRVVALEMEVDKLKNR
ncbi:hypothetical protein J41TS12_11220 [Paenibacillus antibioticophila]|uniref:Uncharacterized protein n=1 Tax=Paenibacillus antibioticophila TaxID=1274374 RepID=A0A919XNG2_9BACL|nr:hypothetical protein [Paenibacillus antibioticophila]GIO36261.1 hypothetical protein J41TS12_11220 [Paenibacillus antibioticophila]